MFLHSIGRVPTSTPAVKKASNLRHEILLPTHWTSIFNFQKVKVGDSVKESWNISSYMSVGEIGISVKLVTSDIRSVQKFKINLSFIANE